MCVSLRCATWLFHTCDKTRLYVWHDSFMCVTWLMNMGCIQADHVTHSYVWHDSFICVTWLFYMRDMTRSYVWHDSFMRVTWLVVHMCDITRVTGWWKPIGCLKLQVIFRKRATNYRALLWKMTYEHKASYDSTPPCIFRCTTWPIQMGDQTDLSICVIWLVYVCDMAQVYVVHSGALSSSTPSWFHMNESRHMYHFTRMNMSCRTYECGHVTHMNESRLIYHVTHMNTSHLPCHTYQCVMSNIWIPSCHT